MSEILRIPRENFLGGNIPKNQRTSFGLETENQGEFTVGEFVFVDMPKIRVPGTDQLKEMTRAARSGELVRLREKVAGKECIFGETFKDRVRNQAVFEIMKDYPKLDLPKISFYLKLIQEGLADEWNFGGGLVAVEKAEPWGWSDFQSRLEKRTRITFDEALGLISKNREQILEKIVPEGRREGINLSRVELGIPTMEESICLEAYHPEITSLNRGKEINRWTSTRIRLGGTDDENNLILASESGYHGEFFSMDPKESDVKVGFDIIARFR